MFRNYKQGTYSNKQHPCPICDNTKGSCKLNDDGSIYCFHSTPENTPDGYVHIRELSSGMGHEFINPGVVSQLLRAATEIQSRGKRATSIEMANLACVPSSWAFAVQKVYRENFPEWNRLSYHHSNSLPKLQKQNSQTHKENFPEASILAK